MKIKVAESSFAMELRFKEIRVQSNYHSYNHLPSVGCANFGNLLKFETFRYFGGFKKLGGKSFPSGALNRKKFNTTTYKHDHERVQFVLNSILLLIIYFIKSFVKISGAQTEPNILPAFSVKMQKILEVAEHL